MPFLTVMFAGLNAKFEIETWFVAVDCEESLVLFCMFMPEVDEFEVELELLFLFFMSANAPPAMISTATTSMIGNAFFIII